MCDGWALTSLQPCGVAELRGKALPVSSRLRLSWTRLSFAGVRIKLLCLQLSVLTSMYSFAPVNTYHNLKQIARTDVMVNMTLVFLHVDHSRRQVTSPLHYNKCAMAISERLADTPFPS